MRVCVNRSSITPCLLSAMVNMKFCFLYLVQSPGLSVCITASLITSLALLRCLINGSHSSCYVQRHARPLRNNAAFYTHVSDAVSHSTDNISRGLLCIATCITLARLKIQDVEDEGPLFRAGNCKTKSFFHAAMYYFGRQQCLTKQCVTMQKNILGENGN